MNIGILSKKKGKLIREIQKCLEDSGHGVKIFTLNDLFVNEMLLNKDFYILKSKNLLFLYAGYFLDANMVPVIPNTNISYIHKDRVESHFSMKNLGFLCPKLFMGTLKTLKSQLKESSFPLISKPIFGSGSKGVKVYNSFQDFNTPTENYLYLENFIKGTHYLAYFIENEICICEKRPFSNEHQATELIESDKEIEKYLIKWKEKYNLLFGHLDLVRETNTNKLYVVDAGTFPQFSNWKHDTDPASKICDLIVKKYQEIRK
ncbi:MAG: ATP-grasp domain-containing protein [Candidatus Lokiarchaeota archaeon]|nr:ATP-grasp domain-containing protein [Candidatus Lokiarchaeota archaeon]